MGYYSVFIASSSSLNASKVLYREIKLDTIQLANRTPQWKYINFPEVQGYKVIGYYALSNNPWIIPFFNDSGLATSGVTIVLYPAGDGTIVADKVKVQMTYMKEEYVGW